MFTLPLLVIKLMTLGSFIMAGLFVMLELGVRAFATKWEDVAEKPLIHLKVVNKK